MALELALVIRGDQDGAKRALDDTAKGIEELGRKAEGAKTPVADMADGVQKTAEAAPDAASGVDRLGDAASRAGGSFGNLKTLAIGALGGIAGALAGAALEAAFGAALTAAKHYFDEVTNSADNIKDDLDAHKGVIAGIGDLWAEAEGAASSYGLVSLPGLRFEAQQNVGRLRDDLESELARARGSGSIRERNAGLVLLDLVTGAGAGRAPFEEALARFRADLEDGRADVVAFREEVAAIAEALPLDDPGRSFAERILGDTQKAAELQAALEQAVDLYRSLTGDAEAAARSLGATATEMGATGEAAGAALAALREYNALIRSLGGAPPSLPLPGFVAGTGAGSFAEGGYTGHGPHDRIAGFVHGQEFVFDAESTARIGVANLEAIRRGVRGYATGGFVGAVSTFAGSFGNALLDGLFAGLAEEIQTVKGAVREFAGELIATRDPLMALAQTVSSLSSSYLNSALGAAGNALGNLFFGGGNVWNIPSGYVPGGFFPGFATGGEFTVAGVGGPDSQLVQFMATPGERVRITRPGEAHGQIINNFFIETPSPRAFAESRSMVARAGARLASAAARHL